MKEKHQLTQQILSGEAPGPIQEFAARGLLPLPQSEFLDIWVYLKDNGVTADIRQMAQDALKNIQNDRAALLKLLSRTNLENHTYAYFASLYKDDSEVAMTLARNRGISSEALSILAHSTLNDVLDILVTNQQKLIENPEIVNILKENPHLSSVQRRRVLEFEEEFLVKGVDYRLKKEEVPVEEAPAETPVHELETQVVEFTDVPVTEEPTQILEQLSPGESVPEPIGKPVETPAETGEPLEEEEAPDLEALEEEFLEDVRAGGERLHQRLHTMKVPEKIMLALLGNREARMALIRDPNRLVAEAVVKSPKLTEAEAESIAGMRHLEPEILRILAGRREFHKNRTFVYRLVANPKTPMTIAMNMLNQLNFIQLRDLSRSRDVPEAIRRIARQRIQRFHR